MKRIYLNCIFIFVSILLNAQTYILGFSASGESQSVDSVEVYNLNQQTSLYVGGTDTVYFMNGIVNTQNYENTTEEMMIFPNPMNHSCKIVFSTDKTGRSHINVYDIRGRLMVCTSDNIDEGTHIYNLSGLPKGAYIVNVRTAEASFNKGLVSVGNNSQQLTLHKISSEARTAFPILPKSTKNTVHYMWYWANDIVLFKGKSGIYSRALAKEITGDEIIDFNFIPCTDSDGNHYTVVSIGQQTWMHNNLATTAYANGAALHNDTNAINWSLATQGSYVWYNNDMAHKNTYGALYNWYAILGDSLCPPGWDIPDTLDWFDLISYTGGYPLAGGALKQTAITLWENPNTGATNTFGFSALPGGYRDSSSVFSEMYQTGSWWSKDTIDAVYAWSYAISHLNTEVAKNSLSKNMGFAVRCILNCKNPFVDAGADVTICEDAESYSPNADANNYSSLEWTSNGDGYFSNPNELYTVYHIGNNDKLTGNVLLALTGQPINSCAVPVSDTLQITLAPLPEISVTSGEHYCEGDTALLSAMVSNGNEIEWICVNGHGLIEDDTQLNTRYFPSPLDWVKGYTDFIIRASSLSPCVDVAENHVRIYYIKLPDVYAGPDQIDIPGTTTNMLGSQPPQFCLGQWFVDGVGGSLNNTSDSASGFTGLENNTYNLVWRIADTNGCKNRDTVIVKFAPEPQDSIPCPDMPTVTDGEGNVYNTVKIGTQCWMRENLKYLPAVSGASSGSETAPRYYVFGYNGTDVNTAKATANYQNYGVLYNWIAAEASCPTGWHLPDNTDWNTLINYNGTSNTAAEKLKGTRTAPDAHPRWNTGNIANNSSGFTAYPGGFRHTWGAFYSLGEYGNWWSSYEDGNNATNFRMSITSLVTENTLENKSYGYSVRCIKDNTSNTVPAVTTAQVDPLSYNMAVAGGVVTDDCGQPITARGIVWSLLPEATIDVNDGITTNGADTGAFKSYATNLQANATYYLRAYATNSNGTAYGEDIIFTTDSVKTVPTVEYHSVNSITSSTAMSGGTVSDDGGCTVDSRGLMWSTSPNVSMINHTGMVVLGSGTGIFHGLITELTPETTYYLRAFAINSEGIGYATEMVFTTPETGFSEPCMGQNTFTDPRDGKTYNIVQIGAKCWMAENLKYLPEIHSFYNNSYYDVRYYVNAYYGTDSIQAVASPNYQNYGVLYNHLAALASCPPGWTLPLEAEWETLTYNLSGGIFTGGNQLKSCRSENTILGGGCLTANHPRWDATQNPVILHGTDDYGFAALPGGYIIGHTTHGTVNVSVGRRAQWWSATSSGMDATSFEIGAHHSNYQMYQSKQWNGLSVRCVKN